MSDELAVAVPVNNSTVDLDSLFDTKTKSDAGVDVDVLRADGEPSGMTIVVLGGDSATCTKIRERFDRARMKILSKGGRNAMDALYDKVNANDVELVAACTLSWRHEKGDLPFPASDKDQLEGFYRKYPLVLDQVRTAMNDRANFTSSSSTS